MMDSSIERTKEDGAKRQFLLTGFTHAAGIRIYAFEGRVEARRIDYTVEVDLALIPRYGIRIQDLPLKRPPEVTQPCSPKLTHPL